MKENVKCRIKNFKCKMISPGNGVLNLKTYYKE